MNTHNMYFYEKIKIILSLKDQMNSFNVFLCPSDSSSYSRLDFELQEDESGNNYALDLHCYK